MLLILIPLFPLIGFLINGLLNKAMPKSAVGTVASLSVLASFGISVFLFAQLLSGKSDEFQITLFDWMASANFQVDFGFMADRLTAIMLLVVTGVGFLIHVYSIGYMQEDEDYPRFMAYMNLFVFFMLLLVLGDNYVMMFAGWEGVGLCSYLLIGFWFKNDHYNEAANKAFIMNRIGDLGFLLGLFLIYQTFGTFNFKEVMDMASSYPRYDGTITAITLLLFIGAVGKSAQIPLFTWLPDAMAGPTPVSALIHAATMVTAGVYMVVRSHPLYDLASFSSEVIAVTGLATALFAATIGLKQNDIKKVLAYSTVSQLGYMFVAAGVGAYSTAIFHLVTHAFFKALLFLCSGSVIHAMHGEQDIRNMGGLKKYLPVTHLTFLIGTLAISGVPVFAGFFSKDEILAMTYSHSVLMFTLLAAGSVITAIYMFRLYWLTFHGSFRGSQHQMEHLHESPSSMTIPLMILAVLSVAGGFIGMPEIFHAPHFLNDFLSPVIPAPAHAVSHAFEYALITVSIITLAIIILMTRNYYVTKGIIPESDEETKGMARVLLNKYYVDEIYTMLIRKPMDVIAGLGYRFIETELITKTVDGIQEGVNMAANGLRYLQTGRTGSYLFIMLIGFIALMIYAVIL
jgi:NADH-quinone oxidoreductase subunit L